MSSDEADMLAEGVFSSHSVRSIRSLSPEVFGWLFKIPEVLRAVLRRSLRRSCGQLDAHAFLEGIADHLLARGHPRPSGSKRIELVWLIQPCREGAISEICITCWTLRLLMDCYRVVRQLMALDAGVPFVAAVFPITAVPAPQTGEAVGQFDAHDVLCLFVA